MLAVRWGVAVDAIAMAEYFCGFGNESPSPAAKCWWDNENGEGQGAVDRRDKLLTLSEKITEEMSDRAWNALVGRYGEAWDWEILPALLESVFSWNEDGSLRLDWDAPLRHIAEVVHQHKAHKEDRTDG